MKRTQTLISHGYLEQQRSLHRRPEGYGGKGFKWAQTVIALAEHFGVCSVLDYGCGRGSLKLRLEAINPRSITRVAEYDPALSGKDDLPTFADLVVCTDVLEHVEPEHLDAVLEHLKSLARRAVFFVVALDEANKILDDGRNAHLILESKDWWADRVTRAGFSLLPWAETWPLPIQFCTHPEKQAKRFIAVGVPC